MRIFIGFDEAESVAYHTLAHSIMQHSSKPVSITPLYLPNLRQEYWRPRDPKQSNDFSFTRFLVPYLSDYVGMSLFMDCDMLLRDDIFKMLDDVDFSKAVSVVKHDYIPKDTIKYLGNTQYKYNRKNWSSVMLFNNSHFHCKKLTLAYVNDASGLDLHQFKWTEDDRIGELDKTWNWLVGEYAYNTDAKIVHYTVGGPYFKEYEDCDYSEDWFKTMHDMKHCQQRTYVTAV